MAISDYTTKTSSLKATKADVRTINAKKIKVNNKDVVIGVQHPDDTREIVTDYDLWSTQASAENGKIILPSSKLEIPEGWSSNVRMVVNNSYYDEIGWRGNIETDKIEKAHSAFEGSTVLTKFESDLKSLKCGEYMFYQAENLQSFKGDLSSLINALEMFGGAYKLKSFKSKKNNVQIGDWMFNACQALTTLDTELNELLTGWDMFSSCHTLSSFKIDMPKLIFAEWMFADCTNLTTFESDLSSISQGSWMFSNCNNMTTFANDLSSLENGWGMFQVCTNLTTFVSDLSSLKSGSAMFHSCKLDVQSFIHIAETINNLQEKGLATRENENEPWTYSDSSLAWASKCVEYDSRGGCDFEPTIGDYLSIDGTRRGKLTLYYNPEYKEGSKELEEILSLTKEISDKGWTVQLDCIEEENTENVSTTSGQKTKKPVVHWYKPVSSNEKYGSYMNANGEYFDIVGGRYIFGDDMSTYGQFTSLKQAEQAMGLTKVERQRKRVR